MQMWNDLSPGRKVQMIIAAAFLALGAWCLASPSSVFAVAGRQDNLEQLPLALIIIGAFGAQALATGLLCLIARFKSGTFIGFAVAMTPFFLFYWWFSAHIPMFNAAVYVGVALTCCVILLSLIGAAATRKAEDAAYAAE